MAEDFYDAMRYANQEMLKYREEAESLKIQVDDLLKENALIKEEYAHLMENSVKIPWLSKMIKKFLVLWHQNDHLNNG